MANNGSSARAASFSEEGMDLTPVSTLLERVQLRGQTAVLAAVHGRAAGVLALADQLKQWPTRLASIA